MLFLGSKTARVKFKVIIIPKKIIDKNTTPQFLNDLYYFPIAGTDNRGFNFLYVHFTNKENYLEFVRRVKDYREFFIDEPMPSIPKRFKEFDDYIKKRIKNPETDITFDITHIPRINEQRIFFGGLVKHISEPKEVLVIGQGNHIRIYDLEQGIEYLGELKNRRYNKFN